MIIRVLQRSDASVFHAHRLDALQESPEAFGSTYAEDLLLSLDAIADRIEESAVAPRRVVLGAFEADTLLGFVGCVQEHKAFIWGTYVHPGSRGKGVGTELLSQLITHASQWEHVKLLTLTVADSARAARRLYYSAGFEQFGREADGLRHDGRSETVEHLALRLK